MSHNLNRSKKAAFTFVANSVDQIAGLFVGFLFTPIIVRGLGAELYGAWGVIAKLTGFVGVSNLNPMAILKLQMGVRQSNSDVAEKNRLVGASIIQWVFTLPLMIILSVILIGSIDEITSVAPGHLFEVQISLIIMIACLLTTQLLSFPGSMLAGHNKQYKGMGINAFAIVLSGIINVLGILLGYGIVVLSLTSILGVLLSSYFRYKIAKKEFPWMEIKIPQKDELISNFKLSLAGNLNTISWLFFTSTDVLIFSYLFGAEFAGVYLTTTAMLRFSIPVVQSLINSGNAGVQEMVGLKDWKNLEVYRRKIYKIAIFISSVIFVPIILFNKNFVFLWIGGDFYGGFGITLLTIVNSIAKQFVLIDSIPLDALLRLKEKSISVFVTGITGIAIGIVLAKMIGVLGVLIGQLIAYVFLLVSIQFLLKKYTPFKIIRHWRGQIIAFIYLISLIVLSGGVFDEIVLDTWLKFGIYFLSTVIPLVIFSWVIIFSASEKRDLHNKLNGFITKSKFF